MSKEISLEQAEELLRNAEPVRYRSSYTAKSAQKFLPDLLAVQKSGKPQLIRYVDHPQCQPHTLYKKVSDALLWFCNHSVGDEKKAWAELRASVTIKMLPQSDDPDKEGILIYMRSTPKTISIADQGPVKPTASLSWRDDYMVWLEHAKPGDPFRKTGILLGAEQIEALRRECDEANITHNITANSITLLR